jgi:Trypsin
MRLTRMARVLAVGALLASIPFVPAGAAAGETDDGWSPAATTLANEWGIPIERAQARVDRQEAAAALADDARARFGASFGGAYLDQARDGVLMLGFTGAVPSAELDRLADRHGLRGLVAGIRVRNSQDRLEAVSAALSAGLASANAGAAVPIGLALRLDVNAVEVSQPATVPATDAQRRFLATAAARYGETLLFVRSDEVPDVAACDFPDCDSPLRGGVSIHGDVTCTAGFMTQSKVDTKKYVLTAGHCLDGDTDATWHTHLANGNAVNIGQPHNFTFGAAGDMGIIRILDTGYWNPKGWVYVTSSNGAYPTVTNSSYTIGGTGWSSPLIGKYLCKTGQTTGTTCGKVEAVGQTVSYPGTTVHNLGRAKIYTCKGDSGGPLYVKHVAYGLVSGISLNAGSTSCGNTTYYQGVKGAANAMNVNLLTA